jgi:hypothetical protein
MSYVKTKCLLTKLACTCAQVDVHMSYVYMYRFICMYGCVLVYVCSYIYICMWTYVSFFFFSRLNFRFKVENISEKGEKNLKQFFG